MLSPSRPHLNRRTPKKAPLVVVADVLSLPALSKRSVAVRHQAGPQRASFVGWPVALLWLGCVVAGSEAAEEKDERSLGSAAALGSTDEETKGRSLKAQSVKSTRLLVLA